MYLVKKLHLLTTTPILTIVTASLMTMPLTWVLSKNCVSWQPNQYWVFTCTPRVGSTSNTSENKHIYFSSCIPRLEYTCPNTQMVLKKECRTKELASHKRMWSGWKEFANLCCVIIRADWKDPPIKAHECVGYDKEGTGSSRNLKALGKLWNLSTWVLCIAEWVLWFSWHGHFQDSFKYWCSC